MHALQQEIDPEIIARCGTRWWNTASSKVAASVVSNAVMRNNLGNFGDVFDNLYNEAVFGKTTNSLRQASPFGLTKQICPRHEGAGPPPYSGGGGGLALQAF